MMDGYGYGHMGWGDWVGMSIVLALFTALVVILAVWAVRAIPPRTPATPAALDTRVEGLEAEVAGLREQAHLAQRDGAGSRR